MEKSFSERVFQLVRRIPSGKVMTYGGVAEALGHPRAARAVGTALAHCGESARPVPWHRVLGASGRPSAGDDPSRPSRQRKLLEMEGVDFRRSGTCDLETYEWIPTSLRQRVLEGKSTGSGAVRPK